MDPYCRSCIDRGTESCLLPSMLDRAVAAAKLATSWAIEGYAEAGSSLHGQAMPEDGMGLLKTVRIKAAVAHIPIEACVIIHQF